MTPITLEQILSNPKLSQAIQKEMGVTPQDIQKSLYNNLTVKQAKAEIDKLDNSTAVLLDIRILSLLEGIELEIFDSLDNPNPLFEAMAGLDDKDLGLLHTHIAKRDQFKSRKKLAKAEMQVEIPCAL